MLTLYLSFVLADIAPGARSEGSRPPIMAIGDEESIESALGLGELAGLTITNEADVLTSGYNVINVPPTTF